MPIYKGVVDTDAILNEADKPYNIWNFQRNSIDKGWRPVDDPTKTRVGELPRKFYSYYPFSQPPVTDDFSINFFPSISGRPNFYPGWRLPAPDSVFPSSPSHSALLPPTPHPRPAAVNKAPTPTTTIKNPTNKNNLKSVELPKDVMPIVDDKVSVITPKSIPKTPGSPENLRMDKKST